MDHTQIVKEFLDKHACATFPEIVSGTCLSIEDVFNALKDIKHDSNAPKYPGVPAQDIKISHKHR